MAGLSEFSAAVSESGGWDIDYVEDGNPDNEWSIIGPGEHNPVWQLMTYDNILISNMGMGSVPSSVPLDQFGNALNLKLYYWQRTMQYDEYMNPIGFTAWNSQNLTSNQLFYVRPDATFSITNLPSEVTLNKEYVIQFSITETTPGSVFPVLAYVGSNNFDIARVPNDDDYYWYPIGNGYLTVGELASLKVSDAYFPDITSPSDGFTVIGIWITSPNSNSGNGGFGITATPLSLGVGQSFEITWESSGFAGNVDILLSVDGDPDFPITIVSNTSNDESYVWTVSDNPTSAAKILIRSSSDNSIFDFSDYFVIRDNKLLITSPSSGVLTAGASVDIEWDTYDSVPNVTLVFKEVNPSPTTSPTFDETEIIATNIANTGSYTWIVPDIDNSYINSKGRIYVYDATDEDNYSLNSEISITGTGRVRLTQNDFFKLALPSTVVTGSTVSSAVRKSKTYTGNVDILASSDNGSTYPTTLYSNIVNTSTPSLNLVSGYNKIKIQSTSTPSINYEWAFTQVDFILSYFNRIGGLSVADILQVGKSPSIFVTVKSTITNIDILLSTDNGSTYPVTILNNGSTTSNGSGARVYNNTWTVPNNPSSQCKLKIRDSSITSNFIETSVFTIQTTTAIAAQQTMTLTSSEGEDFYHETGNVTTVTYYIQKTGFGSDNVDIYLSTDSGSTYPITIVSSLSSTINTNHTYSFRVPNVATTVQARIKVALTSDNLIYAETNIFRIKNSYVDITDPANESNLTIGDTTKVSWTSGELVTDATLYEVFNDTLDSFNLYRYYSLLGIIKNHGNFDWITQGLETTEARILVTKNDINTYQNDTVPVNIAMDIGGNTDPTLDTNNTLRVAQNQANAIIDNTYLSVSDEEQSASEIVFTLTEVTSYGYLYNNGTLLDVSDTFTQDDVDNNLITYTNSSAAPSPTDLFKFTVSDGNGGSISETTFNIDIELTNIMMKVISRLLKFKV